MDEIDFKHPKLKGGACIRWDSTGRPCVGAYTADGYGEYVHYAKVSPYELGLPMGSAFCFVRRGVDYKLTWDRPERFPRYVKELTYKALLYMWNNLYERIDWKVTP